MNKIFLGGTCANTTWRDELIEGLRHYDCDWFNPVVKDWTPECQAIEEDEKNNKCNVHLYVITPEMQGFYSVAEIVNSCWQAQLYGTTVNRVVFCVIRNTLPETTGTWTEQQIKSFKATMTLCRDIAPERFCGDFVNSVVDVLDLMNNNGVIKLK